MNSTYDRQSTPRPSGRAAGADAILQARERLARAKSDFSKAAVAAMKGEPDASATVAEALREVNQARDALRTAELQRVRLWWLED